MTSLYKHINIHICMLPEITQIVKEELQCLLMFKNKSLKDAYLSINVPPRWKFGS